MIPGRFLSPFAEWLRVSRFSGDWPDLTRFCRFQSSKDKKLALSKGESVSSGSWAVAVVELLMSGCSDFVADAVLNLNCCSWLAVGVVLMDDTWDSVSLPLLDESKDGVGAGTSIAAVLFVKLAVAEEARFVRRHCWGSGWVM